MTDKRIYGMSEKAISDMQTHTDEDEVNDIINEQIKGKTPEKLKKEEALEEIYVVCEKHDFKNIYACNGLKRKIEAIIDRIDTGEAVENALEERLNPSIADIQRKCELSYPQAQRVRNFITLKEISR